MTPVFPRPGGGQIFKPRRAPVPCKFDSGGTLRPTAKRKEIGYYGGNVLTLIWEAIIGLIVGALAKFIMPGKDPGGIWITMALGIAGSLLATWIGRAIGWYQDGQAAGFLMSIAGAILLLYAYRLIRKRS